MKKKKKKKKTKKKKKKKKKKHKTKKKTTKTKQKQKQNNGNHYESTPIQIYRKFHVQKLKIFRLKNSDIFFIVLLKT